MGAEGRHVDGRLSSTGAFGPPARRRRTDALKRGDTMLTRRELGKLALAVPAASILGRSDSIFGAFLQAKPNSLIEGVQIGTITYSYGSMLDQSAEATLKVHHRLWHQRDRADGRPGRKLCGRADSRGPRRWWWSWARPWSRTGRGRRATSPNDGFVERPAVRRADSGRGRWTGRRGPTRTRRDDARGAGRPAGAGRQAQSVAHERLDGRLQEAAQDVQRRRRDDLRVEAAQHEHVGRGVPGTSSTSPKRLDARIRRSSSRPMPRRSGVSATSR